MRMLLVNDNPVVAKLTGLSAQKAGVEVEEIFDIEEIEGSTSADIVFIDNAKLNELTVDEFKNLVKAKKYGLIYADENQKNPEFDFYLKKPFLPTEMVDLLSKIKDELTVDDMTSSDDDISLPSSDDDLLSSSFDDSLGDLDSNDDLDEDSFANFDSLMDQMDDEKESSSNSSDDMDDDLDFDSLLDDMDDDLDVEISIKEPSSNVLEESTKDKEEEKEDSSEDFDALMGSLDEDSNENEDNIAIADDSSEDENSVDFDALMDSLDEDNSENKEEIAVAEDSNEEENSVDFDALMGDMDEESDNNDEEIKKEESFDDFDTLMNEDNEEKEEDFLITQEETDNEETIDFDSLESKTENDENIEEFDILSEDEGEDTTVNFDESLEDNTEFDFTKDTDDDNDLESNETEMLTFSDDETEDEQPLVEGAEDEGGILDENQLTKVKELLDDDGNAASSEDDEFALIEDEDLTSDINEVENSEKQDEPNEPMEILSEESSNDIDISFDDEMDEPEENDISFEDEPEEKIEMEDSEEMAINDESKVESEDIDDEFDLISEEELGKALGEEIAADESTAVKTSLQDKVEPVKAAVEPEQLPANEADKSVEGAELISKLSGMDPIALRKLLAGAQININITFPKD
ncbi:hypothetical protein [Hydrogenimonas thermophila]|uniref:Uncharacterized protein n=1 Tax=Hydrogenimonas thermophila TaxID=223786 RepID=A0A1I5PAQ0_9BACT|nr:hypothetical protein [Hydrogenimonas thermophila]SFP31188.1 hypothetical protein SAMN05216234_11443 [Hydrogenimonas thermophila]